MYHYRYESLKSPGPELTGGSHTILRLVNPLGDNVTEDVTQLLAIAKVVLDIRHSRITQHGRYESSEVGAPKLEGRRHSHHYSKCTGDAS